LAAQAAVTPAGKPVKAPIPVAPEVVWEIAVKAVLIPRDGADEATLTVLAGITIALWQEFKKHTAANIEKDIKTVGFIF